ncbi:ABC transporter permease [Candidatus Uhrbacteria bacterium]|nr:ABC transporter permease [Candidatus Uhrbacteria bacterium]
MRMALSQQKSFGIIFLGAVAVLAVWSGLTYTGIVSPIFLPSPTKVGASMIQLIISGKFFIALMYSFARIATATALAALVGIPLGILVGFSRTFERFTFIIFEPMRYVPISALLPLMILWFGIGEQMKIMFLFIGIIFYLIPLIANAVHNIKKEYLLVADDLGLSAQETVRRVVWPAILPHIWDSIIVVNGLGWTYVVLAEMINAKEGLGYLISISGRLQRSSDVFAGLLFITIVALISDRLLRFFRNKYFSWS